MNAGELLRRLHGARSTRDGWTARCPAHEDKSPSLSIREENGKVLVHCFAGCSVEAICSALEVNVRDLFTEHRFARRPVPPVVRDAERQISYLRSRLTPRDRKRDVTVVLADKSNPDPAIARALALAVEGELVQVAFRGGAE